MEEKKRKSKWEKSVKSRKERGIETKIVSDPMVTCPCCRGLGYLEESVAKTVSSIP